MAPITRRSNSAGVSKPPLRKSKLREESFSGLGVGLATSILRSQADAALQNHDNTNGTNGTSRSPMSPISPSAPTNGANDVLRPLSTMAERVGREVEDFAEKIDKWRGKLSRSEGNHELRYRDTMGLVNDLTKMAEQKLSRSKKETSRSHGRSVTRSQGSTAGRQAEEARHRVRDAQIEVNTWKLFRIMLSFEFTDPKFDRDTNRQVYLHHRGPFNAYTSGGEIWAGFRLENDAAREQENILRWLEETARSNGGTMDEIMEELESKSGKGTSQWDKGWLHTREKLKGEKRTRLWDTPLEASAPLRSGVDGKFAVTQLDPDAPSRQDRVLEPADIEAEKAVWEACFRMLRSGVPWDEVRAWTAERGEQWRAASLGRAGETQQCKTETAGPDCGGLWRRICFRIAQSPGVSAAERAIYGTLAGDIESAISQCRDWDDLLYAHYNGFLLENFEQYLRDQGVYQERNIDLPEEKLPAASALPAFSGQGTVGGNTVARLLHHSLTKTEASMPEKNIQGALIGRQLIECATAVGVAVSQNMYAAGRGSEMLEPTDVEVDPSFGAIAEDETALRLIVHFALIHEAFRPIGDEKQKRTMDNIVVQYMDFLRRAGKIEALPTYALSLQRKRAEKVLGRMMADIANPEEQRILINLLIKSGLGAANALVEQYIWAIDTADFTLEQHPPISHFKILEETDKSIWPEQRISASHIQHHLTPAEEKIIRSCDWFLLAEGQLKGVLSCLSYVYKCLLFYGRWSAALALSERISWKKLIRLKTPYYYHGKVVDFMEGSGSPAINGDGMRRTTRASSRQPSGSKHSSATQNGDQEESEENFTKLYKGLSRTYYELMQLTLALKALSDWRKAEDDALIAIRNKERPSSDARKALRDAFADVCTAMEPIFHDFLTHADEDQDAVALKAIRHAYLPEIVIAYNSVLHFAGASLGRDHFTKSLELSTLVASEENKELAEALVSTGRMGELVRGLALTSKQLLQWNQEAVKAEGTGRKRKASRDMGRKRGWDGRTLEIWDLGKVN